MTDRHEDFLSRWSRRKLEAKAGTVREGSPGSGRTAPSAEPPGEGQAGSPGPPAGRERAAASDGAGQPGAAPPPAKDFGDIDFDTLGRDSDYKRFMTGEVPADVRAKALGKLWLSDPVLFGPDQLNDYIEDFTDAAKVPKGIVGTAYKVGRGFLSDAELAEWERLGRPEPAPPAPAVTVAVESPDQPEVAAFLAASDRYAASLYPAESNHLVGLPVLTSASTIFLVARRGGTAVGCGALLDAGDGTGELKRMWVEPTARGQGVGRHILEALEAHARTRGLGLVRLETGIHQHEAIGLYRRHGYVACVPFGSYRADPLSLFMEKRLG